MYLHMNKQLPDELIFLQNRNAVQKKTNARLDGKISLISGSTSGVGLSAVRALAAAGSDIVMLCRNPNKGAVVKNEIENLHHVKVDVITADFSRLEEVRKATSRIIQAYPRIDILVNSAGMHSTTRQVSAEGFELVFCVNHLAQFLLTYSLLELLISSKNARIIQVSSEGHRFGGLDRSDLHWERRFYTGLRGYGASKTAQMLTTWKFAQILHGSGSVINAIHPGDVRTNIGNNNGPAYRWFLHHVTWRMLKDVSISGEAIHYIAAAPEMAQVNGKFFHLTFEETPAKQALDPVAIQAMWEISKRLTGLPL